MISEFFSSILRRSPSVIIPTILSDFNTAVQYLKWISTHKERVLSSLLSVGQDSHQSGKVIMYPVGITCAYLPFSTPLTSFASFMSAVLLSGCSSVLFAPVQSAVITNIFTRFDKEVGFPKGCFNLLFADFEYFRHSLSDSRVAAVVFTGSKEHCERLQKNSSKLEHRKLILNSGGKNSAIICKKADMENAAQGVVYGAFKTAGQLCTSTSRVFIHSSILSEFCESLSKIIAKINIGTTDTQSLNQKGPFMGPLYSEKSVDRFLRFQTMAHREAQETLFWGKSLESNKLNGYFVHPGVHLMSSFNPKSAYQYNILMCPDLALYVFDDFEEAIENSNQVDSSLCLSIYDESKSIENIRHTIKAPNIFWNLPTVGKNAILPFACRNKTINHTYQGIGIAKDLSYPQIVIEKEENKNTLDLDLYLN